MLRGWHKDGGGTPRESRSIRKTDSRCSMSQRGVMYAAFMAGRGGLSNPTSLALRHRLHHSALQPGFHRRQLLVAFTAAILHAKASKHLSLKAVDTQPHPSSSDERLPRCCALTMAHAPMHKRQASSLPSLFFGTESLPLAAQAGESLFIRPPPSQRLCGFVPSKPYVPTSGLSA
jgi:hypothetical protein